MLNDKQSLSLCGLMTFGLFAGGLLDILDNFILLTILTLIFLTIIINLFINRKKPDTEEEKDK
ncbi:hypothetical protein [Algibacter aquimarinus]|uniref:Uncharacterized protein n=1 Tax=Algibacter aquimarinus TaxID=1136748 RepID=A0ABP9H365_9FLAO